MKRYAIIILSLAFGSSVAATNDIFSYDPDLDRDLNSEDSMPLAVQPATGDSQIGVTQGNVEKTMLDRRGTFGTDIYGVFGQGNIDLE